MATGARFLGLPVAVSPTGALRTTDPDQHVRDLVLQVLLTEPGERVNRPDFGCGVRRLVFSAGSEVLRTTISFLVMQNLERWLGDRINVEQVDVRAEPSAEEVLLITVVYVIRRTAARTVVSVGVTPTGALLLPLAAR